MKITNLSSLTFIYWEQSIGWIDLTSDSIIKKVVELSKLPYYLFLFRLDWQREGEENFEALAIPKSTEISVRRFGTSFDLSVSRLRSMPFKWIERSREARYQLFCLDTKGQRK
jgi:hypothetical protein